MFILCNRADKMLFKDMVNIFGIDKVRSMHDVNFSMFDAVVNNDVETMSKFVAINMSTTICDSMNHTLLEVARQNKSVDMIQYLIKLPYPNLYEFIFRKMTFEMLWKLWYIGDHNIILPPFRDIDCFIFYNSNTNQMFSLMKYLMTYMENLLRKNNIFVQNPTEIEVYEMFKNMIQITELKRYSRLNWEKLAILVQNAKKCCN